MPALGRNLIVNPGFETGDMTGWKTKGNNVIQTRENSKYIVEPHGGDYWIMFGSGGSMLQSSFFTVQAGMTLEISLWKADGGEMRKNVVSMAFPDGTVEDIIKLPAIDRKDLFKWQRFSTTWTVPEGITSAALRINTVNGFGRFDDISVRQII